MYCINLLQLDSVCNRQDRTGQGRGCHDCRAGHPGRAASVQPLHHPYLRLRQIWNSFGCWWWKILADFTFSRNVCCLEQGANLPLQPSPVPPCLAAPGGCPAAGAWSWSGGHHAGGARLLPQGFAAGSWGAPGQSIPTWATCGVLGSFPHQTGASGTSFCSLHTWYLPADTPLGYGVTSSASSAGVALPAEHFVFMCMQTTTGAAEGARGHAVSILDFRPAGFSGCWSVLDINSLPLAVAITYFEAFKLCGGCVGPPGLLWKEKTSMGEVLLIGIPLGWHFSWCY